MAAVGDGLGQEIAKMSGVGAVVEGKLNGEREWD